ncbi:hypothetical protein B1757_04105 [Acidithiobacillus marinus]|uniref:Glycosyl transferase family 1 n=1 Tax=Acidithiobacillus marinus TaxID=187490 RepID=A0A2I1DNE9_9PROT|nr:glycosyltransferase family 4 protein [Acidithiobacillus marinus]PKY11410.1 hypothetical protein B1757_04105 [Acidithiobacillus marinus]
MIQESITPKAFRTLQLGSSWLPEHSGGLERYYHDLLQNLPAQQVSCRGLVVGSREIEKTTNGQVRAFSRPEKSLLHRWFKARMAMKKVLKEFQPELVCIHFALYGISATDLLSKQAMVVHFHGPWTQESAIEKNQKKSDIKFHIEKKIYQKADRIIVLSRAFKEILCQYYHINEHKISVAPAAIHTENFILPYNQKAAREKLGWPLDRPIIFAVRRISRRMGLDNMIKTLALLRKRFPDILLMVAGKGQIMGELKQMAKDLNVEDNIQFMGFVSENDLVTAYRAADFSIVPSIALEGFGLITLESLATGTPVLVTPVGGLPETIRPFHSDWVTKNSEPESIAEAITDIFLGRISTPSFEQCQTYAKNFDWQIIAPKIADIYRETIS